MVIVTLAGVWSVGTFIITMPVSILVVGGYILLWAAIIRTLQGLNVVNQACYD